MTTRLLDRQVSLIEYLTSGAAIFNDSDHGPVDPSLSRIDCGLLGIEARFSFEKRMEKIVAVLPRTFDLLDANKDRLLRDFVEACPPSEVGRRENARQFYDFLSAHWRRERPTPPYLPDVAACELAIASARILAEDYAADQGNSWRRAQRACIRRSLGVLLLRVAHDIRPLFENAFKAGCPVARDVPLAIVAQASNDHPKIFELAPAVFDLLGSIDNWVDQDTFDDWEHADKLITDLAIAGLIEIRR